MSHVDARFRSRRFRDESEIGRITIFGAETPKNRWRPARDVIVMPSGNFPDGRFLSENRRRMLPSPGNFLWPTTKKLSHTSRRFRGVPESQNPGGPNPEIRGSRNLGIGGCQIPGGVPPPGDRGPGNPESGCPKSGVPGSGNFGVRGSKFDGFGKSRNS